MTKRVALMLPLAVAAAVTHTRRATLKHTAYAVAAAAAPAGAKELYYTKEEFCRISDEQSKNGIEFGCEQYVASPEKRARMRLRALDAITRASEKLDTYRVETAASGAVIRGALRRGPLGGLRTQGRRLATLTAAASVHSVNTAQARPTRGWAILARRTRRATRRARSTAARIAALRCPSRAARARARCAAAICAQ